MTHVSGRNLVFCCVATLGVAIACYAAQIGAAADPAPEPPAKEPDAYTRFANQISLWEPSMKSSTTLKVGEKLPEIKCADFDGRPVDIDTLYGDKATLIVCWSTWCHPCMQQLPHEVHLSHEFKKLGLKVIGVNADKDPQRAKAAASVLGMDWPTIYDPRDAEAATGIVKTLGVSSWPTLLLMDADRKLIATSPYLTSSTIMDAGAGDIYQVRFLDLALTKVLGPLPFVPLISPTH